MIKISLHQYTAPKHTATIQAELPYGIIALLITYALHFGKLCAMQVLAVLLGHHE